jgi:phage shock protein A
MSESLIKRVSRLVAGTFTTWVDAAENAAPAVVIREAIEEIDSAIEDVRAEIGRQQALRHNAHRELSKLSARQGELEEHIRIALKEDRADLAEHATEELLGVEDRIPLIETHVADAKAEETELQRYFTALKAKRQSMEEDLREVKATQAKKEGKDVVSGSDTGPGSNVEQRVERADNAVNRVKSAVTGLPADNAAGDPKKSAELEELHKKHRIAERLAAFQKGE